MTGIKIRCSKAAHTHATLTCRLVPKPTDRCHRPPSSPRLLPPASAPIRSLPLLPCRARTPETRLPPSPSRASCAAWLLPRLTVAQIDLRVRLALALHRVRTLSSPLPTSLPCTPVISSAPRPIAERASPGVPQAAPPLLCSLYQPPLPPPLHTPSPSAPTRTHCRSAPSPR